MEENVNEIWQEFARTKSRQSRDQLVLHYQSLVGYVAKGFQSFGSSVLEWDDLISAGTLGLIEAIQRFDISRNIKFTTFATFRIRGAILDVLREIDWAPRKVRSNVKQVYKVISDLQNKLSRNPTEEEVADKLAIPLEKYHKILESMYTDRFVSLQDIVFQHDDNEISRETFIESYQGEEYFAAQWNDDLEEQLKDILKKLPTKERLVLTLYYYEGLNLADIASVLDVTESRVCQIHAQSLLLVKAQILKKDLYQV
ncbi:MAG TPA: FliA/WhiG family RNA polymerase sigma factor [bacterium]|nr:FliA/WhiG family RNA polymerase sigma factor [bacterium]HPN43191.1 FliA/WhiG family RNA polymerase sigma factor [bacterium]